MDNFPEKYNHPRLTQKETENLIIPITSNKIELTVRKLPKKKLLDQMASWLNFINYLVNTYTHLPQSFPKSRRGGNTSKLIR